MGKRWKRVPPFLSKNILQGSLEIKLCQNLVATLIETIIFKDTSALFIGLITDDKELPLDATDHHHQTYVSPSHPAC